MDSKEISKILDKALNGLKKDIQDSLKTNNRNASGKTSNSLRVSTKISGFEVVGTLFGSSVLEVLEYGRGRTKNAGSTATWETELRNWMRIRGIDQSAFYPIWRKINADGYEGTKGLISDPINEFKKSIAKDLTSEILKDFRSNGINSNQ